MKVTQSCLTLCDPMDYAVHGILQGSLSLLQGIFQTQELNPGSHIAGWVTREAFHWLNIPYFAYPFISWWILGSFHFLPIMNDVVENIHEHIFWLYVLFLLIIYLGVECWVKLTVIFWGTFYCFPKWLYYYIIPPTMYDIWGFDFFISVPKLVIVGCFLF